MLTEKGFEDRKWGPYPALRLILQNKALSEHYYGPTSVSDNQFAQIPRTLEIALLVVDNRGEVFDPGNDGPEVARDVCRLKDELHHIAGYFRQLSEQLPGI